MVDNDGLEIRVSVCVRGCMSARRVAASVSPRLLGQMGKRVAFKWQDVLERVFFVAHIIKLLLMYNFCYNEFIFSLNYICHVKEPQFN